MERIIRTNAPGWLEKKWKEWGRQWAEKLSENPAAKFSWRRCKNKGREDLEFELSQMTQDHCSFCDAYPMGSRLKSTIEHFKPKSRFPDIAYKWDNLFLACSLCQEKGDLFDHKLLKPDEATYQFDKYFDIDWFSGRLLPNGDASQADQERARITIKLYRLNDNGKPEDRLQELDVYKELSHFPVDRFSYRFYLKRG